MRIMVVGAGHIGISIISYLSEKNHKLIVIEKDETRCKEVANHADAAIFMGNGADRNIWNNIEAEKIDALLVLTNNDEINMKVCEIANKQFGIPFIIARVNHHEDIDKMKESGADIAICPSEETKRLFLNALERLPAEILCEYPFANFKIIMVTIPSNGMIIGKTVDQLGISKNCRIASIFRNGMVIFTTEDFAFKGGDRVLLLGLSEFVEKIIEKLTNVEIT